MANPVVHFEVIGKDAEKTRAFYSKIFGWEMNVMPEMDYGMVDNKGEGIGGGIGGGGGQQPPHATFYIQVDDPQGTLDQIEKSGGKTVMPVMEIPGSVTIAMFADLDGNLVGLVKGM